MDEGHYPDLLQTWEGGTPDLSPVEELTGLVSGGSRAIVISQREVNLKSLAGENRIFLLKLAEGSLASGGRGGGFGERRVVRVLAFMYHDGECAKLLETADEGAVSSFEVPYHVARLPLTLADGTESMGYGVVDPELVQQFLEKAGLASSP